MNMVDCTFMGEHQRELNAYAHDILGRIEELYEKALFGNGGDTTPALTILPIIERGLVKYMKLQQTLEFHRLRDAGIS